MNPLKKIYLLEDRNMHLVKGKIDLNTGLLDGEFMEMLPHIKAVIDIDAAFVPFSTEEGTPSAVQTYDFKVSNYYGVVKIVMPEGFEIYDGASWRNSLVFATVNGLYDATFSVRMTGKDVGTFEGNITHIIGSQVETIPLEGTVTAKPVDRFITVWDIPSDGYTLTFPVGTSQNPAWDYNYQIYWGDGTPTEIKSNDTPPSHTYAKAGRYEVWVSGSLPHFAIANGAFREVFGGVLDFGDVGFQTLERMFQGVTRNVEMPNTISGHTAATSTERMFYEARKFNRDIGSWDMSNINNMAVMFYDAQQFNQNLNSWNVSNVTNMNSMFNRAYQFNGDISGWNVSNVTNMLGLFFRCYAFNQNISNWNVSKVKNMRSMFYHALTFNQDISGWNVGAVETMWSMFNDAIKFNQDIGGWNVSNVTDMSYMFRLADTFNQDISGWDVSNVTDMTEMFWGAKKFNQDLSEWCVIKIPTKPFDFDFNAYAWELPRPIWGTCPN